MALSFRGRLLATLPPFAQRAKAQVRSRLDARRFAREHDEPLGYPFAWATFALEHGLEERPGWLSAHVSAVSKVAIMPGETFSLRRLAAPSSRWSWKGRRLPLASDIERDGDTLATLVYNLALLGGLHATERHAHPHDTSDSGRRYPPGRDAVVGSSAQDLRILNTSGVPLIFVLGLDERRVYGELRGREPLDCDITLELVGVEPLLDRDRIVRDPLFAPAEERIEEPGAPGARVTWRRTTHRAGFPPLVEEMMTTYWPRRAIVRRGPRPAPVDQ